MRARLRHSCRPAHGPGLQGLTAAQPKLSKAAQQQAALEQLRGDRQQARLHGKRGGHAGRLAGGWGERTGAQKSWIEAGLSNSRTPCRRGPVRSYQPGGCTEADQAARGGTAHSSGASSWKPQAASRCPACQPKGRHPTSASPRVGTPPLPAPELAPHLCNAATMRGHQAGDEEAQAGGTPCQQGSCREVKQVGAAAHQGLELHRVPHREPGRGGPESRRQSATGGAAGRSSAQAGAAPALGGACSEATTQMEMGPPAAPGSRATHGPLPRGPTHTAPMSSTPVQACHAGLQPRPPPPPPPAHTGPPASRCQRFPAGSWG